VQTRLDKAMCERDVRNTPRKANKITTSVGWCFTLLFACVASEILAVPSNSTRDAQAAWEELLHGNQQFVNDNFTLPDISSARRHELFLYGQTPKAAIVSCSDSRVPPEYLFDEGLGDIFLVRLAGSVVDRNALGSLEYALEHLGVNLLVVMGHHGCGAVQAAVDQALSGQPVQNAAESSIWSIVESILPAAKYAIEQQPNDPEERMEIAVRTNVKNQCDSILTNSKSIRDAVVGGKVMITTAESYLDSGMVLPINYTCVPDESTRFPSTATTATTTTAQTATSTASYTYIYLNNTLLAMYIAIVVSLLCSL